MTADELLSLIRALPDARRLPADPPLMATTMVAGIEIASTGPAPDRALRRIWRERRGGGATPLLLLTEDTGRPGSVRALGLVDATVPIRSVEAGALHEAIRRLASRPRLEAVRELAAELDRLDQDTGSCEAASQGNLASSGFRSSDEVR
jgi:enoyl-CoA hydratase/carnithine racemase